MRRSLFARRTFSFSVDFHLLGQLLGAQPLSLLMQTAKIVLSYFVFSIMLHLNPFRNGLSAISVIVQKDAPSDYKICVSL
jgi:hypothetical protein